MTSAAIVRIDCAVNLLFPIVSSTLLTSNSCIVLNDAWRTQLLDCSCNSFIVLNDASKTQLLDCSWYSPSFSPDTPPSNNSTCELPKLVRFWRKTYNLILWCGYEHNGHMIKERRVWLVFHERLPKLSECAHHSALRIKIVLKQCWSKETKLTCNMLPSFFGINISLFAQPHLPGASKPRSLKSYACILRTLLGCDEQINADFSPHPLPRQAVLLVSIRGVIVLAREVLLFAPMTHSFYHPVVLPTGVSCRQGICLQ